MAEYYNWIKAFHLIFVISWMAGMLYLPRIFAYHAKVAAKSPEDQIFQVMEKRLLRIIMNPAMILTIISGLILAQVYGYKNLGGWFHIKLTLVVIMLGLHGFFAKVRKDFELNRNKHSNKFYRIINEIPAIIMIIIVIMVIVKPFE